MRVINIFEFIQKAGLTHSDRMWSCGINCRASCFAFLFVQGHLQQEHRNVRNLTFFKLLNKIK